MATEVLPGIGLFLAGILAGEELVVRYGVQPALNGLPDRAHILARQALVRRLRVLVPIVMVPTVIVGIAVLVIGGSGAGFGFRWATAIALVGVVLISVLGTVPINIRVNDWPVDSPPENWRDEVRRWELIDVFRSSAAVIAFGCAVVATALRLSAG